MKKSLFARIVVGIDDSEPSSFAASYGARLARDHHSQVLFCHAVNWLPIIAEASSSGIAVDATPIIDALKDAGAALLDQAVATAKRFGVEADRRALEGDPATALLTLAHDADCTLILMGTHGRRGLSRLFLGSTTEAVLRGSTIPVLTLRSANAADEEGRRCLGRVLVGIDNSEQADAALEVALELPPEDRRELLLYSVVDIDVPVGLAYTATAQAQTYAQAQSVMEHAVATARIRGVTAHGYAVDGRPDNVIVNAATEKGADLIVLGSHGRRGLRRFFLGSIAETVVRSAGAPVLVVRTSVEVPRSEAHPPAHEILRA